MTLEECYNRIGGDYFNALTRLGNEKRLERFLALFLQDKSFQSLGNALTDGNAEDAYRFAHSLKGVSMTLGLSRLSNSAASLTESLRTSEADTTVTNLYDNVVKDYQCVLQNIQQFMQSQDAEKSC